MSNIHIPDPASMTGLEWAESRARSDGYSWLARKTGLEITPEALFHQTVIPVRTAWNENSLLYTAVEEIRATLHYTSKADRLAGGYLFTRGFHSNDEKFQRALVAELRRRPVS